MTSYDYYPAVLYAIDRISQGSTKTAACDMSNISIATFDKYVAENVELKELLAEAEQRGFDAMADALLQPHNHKVYGMTDPKMAKIVSDNIKWLLSKRAQKVYGDKLEVKHEITLDRAVVDALSRAKDRALQGALPPPTDTANVIEAEYVVVQDEDDADLAYLLS